MLTSDGLPLFKTKQEELIEQLKLQLVAIEKQRDEALAVIWSIHVVAKFPPQAQDRAILRIIDNIDPSVSVALVQLKRDIAVKAIREWSKTLMDSDGGRQLSRMFPDWTRAVKEDCERSCDMIQKGEVKL